MNTNRPANAVRVSRRWTVEPASRYDFAHDFPTMREAYEHAAGCRGAVTIWIVTRFDYADGTADFARKPSAPIALGVAS